MTVTWIITQIAFWLGVTGDAWTTHVLKPREISPVYERLSSRSKVVWLRMGLAGACYVVAWLFWIYGYDPNPQMDQRIGSIFLMVCGAIFGWLGFLMNLPKVLKARRAERETVRR